MALRRTAAALVVAAVALSGCSAARTPKTFCATMDEHRVRYEQAMGEAQSILGSGDLAGLVGGVTRAASALGDIQLMWDDLVEVAPDDIRADVEIVRDTNREQLTALQEKAGDPLALLASGITAGITHSGSYQRVNDYALEHCGSAPFVDGGQR